MLNLLEHSLFRKYDRTDQQEFGDGRGRTQSGVLQARARTARPTAHRFRLQPQGSKRIGAQQPISVSGHRPKNRSTDRLDRTNASATQRSLPRHFENLCGRTVRRLERIDHADIVEELSVLKVLGQENGTSF